LHTPTGDIVLQDGEPLADGSISDQTPDGFGGETGVFLFNVGNCGANVKGENFDAYLPIPTAPVAFKLTGYANSYEGFYALNISGITGPSIMQDGDFTGWCVDGATAISWNQEYMANVYTLTNIASIPDRPRLNLIKAKVGRLHWLINHIQEIEDAGFTPEDAQKMFWRIINGKTYTSAINDYADAVGEYELRVGDYALLIFDPVDGKDTAVQAFGVRIDP